MLVGNLVGAYLFTGAALYLAHGQHLHRGAEPAAMPARDVPLAGAPSVA